jgi:hypothetical protein
LAQLFAGTVHKRNKDGTYNITFDDGDTDRRVKPDDVGVYNPEDYEVCLLLCVNAGRWLALCAPACPT